MTSSTAVLPQRTTRPWLAMVPLMLLIVGAILANLGVSVASDATAATSNVTVSAQVASNVTLTPCGASFTVPGGGGALTMSAYNYGTCEMTFGATNNSALPLTVVDNAGAGQFFATSPSGFTEKAAGCGSLATAGTLGVKTSTPPSAGTAATSNLCGTTLDAESLSTSARFEAIPSTATTICTTSALGNQICAVTIGILTGASATAGTNSGQLNFAAT